jgi:endonuclease/exonuclease/phosphatase family metal-dependent hydrolase
MILKFIKPSLLALFIAFGGFVSAQSTTDLKVMTFNLRFGELASLEHLAGYIKQQQPDLVALQECDWKTNRTRAPKQTGKAFMNELAYNTELFGIYGKAIDYAGGYYGVGVLSKYPIIKSERILLPNPRPKTEQRVMLMTEIELPGNNRVTFISTHLEVSSAKVRQAQIKFIKRKIRSIKTPVIIAGDFNTIPSSKEVISGFSHYMNATDSNFTYSTIKPTIKIDYIFGYPKKQFNLISSKVDTDCKLSDHFPVSSVIQLIYK